LLKRQLTKSELELIKNNREGLNLKALGIKIEVQKCLKE